MKARELLEDIIARDPERAEAHRVLGLVYYRMKLPTQGSKQMAIAADLSENARHGNTSGSTQTPGSAPAFK